MKEKITIGILGGGFAGLYCALHLSRKHSRAEICLFDRNNYFLYTPFLHEVATGTVDSRHIAVPIRKIADPNRVQIRCEEVTRINLPDKAFETSSGKYKFDRLVIAAGSEANFYDIPGARENSLTFKTIYDAIRLRNSIIDILERAAIEKNPAVKREMLTFNVAGAGCTGVELVSEIAEFLNQIISREYPEIKPEEIRVNLIEAAPNVLCSFPPYLSRVAAERLKDMGIELMIESPISSVSRDFIRLASGRRIPNGLLVWAAGIRARDLAFDPLPEKDGSGRIIINEFLEIPGFEGVSAIGDGALCLQDGKTLPATASVAVQQARYAAERIMNPGPKPFIFKNRGDMASLGFMFGVCDVYGWQFRKFLAWIMWKMFKLAMMPRYKNRFQILSDWLIAWAFRRDTSRLT
jgi:NADH:ubiquinone reductase (H+-translocating)